MLSGKKQDTIQKRGKLKREKTVAGLSMYASASLRRSRTYDVAYINTGEGEKHLPRL